MALIVWSLAAVACAEATAFGPAAASLLATVGFVATPSVAGFMAARFALGLGEGGNFPAAIKSVAEWFPQAGARAGDRHLQLRHQRRRGRDAAGRAVDHASRYGWYWAFVITGALGFFWLDRVVADVPTRRSGTRA